MAERERRGWRHWGRRGQGEDTDGIGGKGRSRRTDGAADAGAIDREEAVRSLLDSHAGYARALVANEMRRRNGRHRSISPSEFGHDMVLEAAGLDEAGHPRAAAEALTADDPRVRGRIFQRIRWRLDDREQLARVKARRTAVDVHEGWDMADGRAADPLERVATRELTDRAAWIRDHRRQVLEANAPAERPSLDRSTGDDLLADDADPDASARLHAFARRDARKDPKAARQLALHVLVEVLGIPVSTARAAVGTTRSTAYRELDEIKQRLSDPPRE